MYVGGAEGSCIPVDGGCNIGGRLEDTASRAATEAVDVGISAITVMIDNINGGAVVKFLVVLILAAISIPLAGLAIALLGISGVAA